MEVKIEEKKSEDVPKVMEKIVEKTVEKRTYKKKLTIREAIENKLSLKELMLLIPEEKRKRIPERLTWQFMLKMANSYIETGEKLTLESDIFETLTTFSEALKSGFLGKSSPVP